MKMKLLLPFCFLLSMTMFGQSLTLGAVVYAMPLNGAVEFTLMAGGYQSQPRGQTQLQAPTMGMEPFISGKTAGPASVSPGQTPTCRVAASTEQSGK